MQGTLAFTTVRNEGPFLLEWIAWQKSIGFENVLVMFNDCTDHSPQMLRLLQKAGEIGIRRHEPGPDQHPQPSAYRACRSHPMVKAAKWMFTCDVDEYLTVHTGDGTIGHLLNRGDVPWQGMAVHWRIFGTNGHQTWQDGLVHRRFLHASPAGASQNNCVKSFVRDPLSFRKLRSHTPRFWGGDGAWGAGGSYWVFSNGDRWAEYDPDDSAHNGSRNDQITHSHASVNHYILQTDEQFDFKRGRASAAEGLDRYSQDFKRRFDHNSTPNDTALKHADRFDGEYARLCAIPGVMRLHHLCCADFLHEMAEKRGDDVRQDPRYIHHLQEAEANRAAPKPARDTV